MPRPLGKWKYLEKRRNTEGRVHFYVRRSLSLPRFKIEGRPGTPEFEASYQEAIKASEQLTRETVTPIKRPTRKQEAEKVLIRSLSRAKTRANAAGIPFDLDADYLLNLADLSDHRCALTGIPFSAKEPSMATAHAFTPSIDRIIPEQGYTKGNVRIVAFCVNVMLSNWGEETFIAVARQLLRNRTNRALSKPTKKGKLPQPKKQPAKSTQ